MTKYAVTRKLNRRMALTGFVRETRENGQIISITKEVMAGPGDIFETDVDLDSWVKGGYLTVLSKKDEKTELRRREGMEKARKANEALKAEAKAEEDEEEAEDAKDEDEVEDEVEGHHVEYDDGSIECAYCDQSYRKDSRALGWMKKHLKKAHDVDM